MKLAVEYKAPQPRRGRTLSKTEVVLGALVVFLLLKLYAPLDVDSSVKYTESEYFQCHAPQPNLLNAHQIDHKAFEADIKWTEQLLQGFVQGTNGYGQAADSVSLSVFLPNGPPVYEAGFGRQRANESNSKSADENSIYRMASITKMFTTAQLILQKQQGLIDLDQDVSTILGDFSPPQRGWSGMEEKRIVTIRQLLSHMSGLIRDPLYNITSLSDLLETEKPIMPSRAEIMYALGNTPAIMPSFTTPIYSNIGFDVAGYVAENIGGVKYKDLLTRDIFQPLGMSSSAFRASGSMIEHIVVPSEPNSLWSDISLGDTDPAGGMFSSAADLRRFGQSLLGPGLPLNDTLGQSHGPILTKPSVREWMKPMHAFDDGLLSIGLSWEIYTLSVHGRRMSLYTKAGNLPGFSTLFGVDPEREFGFALLISGLPSNTTALGMRIAQRFAKTVDEQRQTILAEEYAGRYAESSSSHIDLEIIDGGLAMTEAVVEGLDLFDFLHLGEGDNGVVTLWPTLEAGVFRLAIGRPPEEPYLGCMHKFASIDPAYSKGFPIDLVILDGQKLAYPAMNLTLDRK